VKHYFIGNNNDEESNSMAYIPIALNLDNRRVVIIGGGKIAKQKVVTLLKYDASITLYATKILDELKELPIEWHQQSYAPELLEGAHIVYGATDNRVVNAEIAVEARKQGALVNVIDDPANCDFVSPALEKRGDISIAVTSNGKNVRDSIATRNKIRELLND